jgi:hypothetical protein
MTNSALHLIPWAHLRAARVAQHVGSTNTAGAISSLLAQTSAAMDATNAAVLGCASMAATDVTTWQGLYSGWQSFASSLAACLQGLEATQYAPPTVQCISSWGLNWGTAYSQLQSYQADTVTWQNRVKAACPSYQPAPPPAPPGPSSPSTPGGGSGAPSQSWLCTTTGIGCSDGGSEWPTAIKWAAIAGIGLLAAWYLGPLIATIAGVGAGAIRKRASGSDEFAPVSDFGDFGPMVAGPGDVPEFGDLSAAGLEPIDCGDVSADQVIGLFGTGAP